MRNKLDKLNSVEIWWLNFLEAFGCFPMRPLVWHIKLKWRDFFSRKVGRRQLSNSATFSFCFKASLWWDIRAVDENLQNVTHFDILALWHGPNIAFYEITFFSNTRLILAYLLSNFIFLTFTSCYEIYILEYFTWYLCTLESHFRRFTENEPWSDCHPKILKYSKYGKINVLEIFRMWKCQNMEPWSDCHPKYSIRT